VATFVQDGYNDNSTGSSVASIAVALTGVTAGNLIAVWVKHEGTSTSITVSDGTTTLTAATYKANGSANSFGQWHYLLSANSGNKTYTATFGASRSFPTIIVFEYSITGSWAFQAQNTATGTSTSPNSGNFTTTGTDGVAFGGYAENSTNFTSSEQINGVAADGSKRTAAAGDPRCYTTAWRKTFTSGYTGAASATLASAEWVCCGIAFGVSGGGGGPPALMGQVCL
jgi:hypothetical protein